MVRILDYVGGAAEPAAALDGLNPAQRVAVTHGDGPLLVLAGAGSGKTRVITHRIAHLVAGGVPARHIVALTFTNKAAREMKERVAKLLGSERLPMFVGTFHSYSLNVLRRWAPLLGYSPGFTVYDAGDQLALVKRVAKDLGLSDKAFPPRSLLDAISGGKNVLWGPDDFARERRDFFGTKAAEVYRAYQRRLVAANAMDFDDLIRNAVRLFSPTLLDPESGRAVGEVIRARIEHLLVDEYQDTNVAQAELVRQLVREAKGVCAVGDDDQSIYGWRGAVVGNILGFDRQYPGAKVVKLEQNYRSTQPILDAASEVIAKNTSRHGKKLWTERQGGAKLKLYLGEDERDEARWVAEEIDGHRRAGRALSDCAVLFRTGAQSRPFEDELRRRDWPYVLVGGVKFYERAEVKDALAYLRVALQPKDDGALLRVINVPARGIGASTIEALRAAADAGEADLWSIVGNDVALAPLGDRARRAVREFRAVVEDIAREAASGRPTKTLEYALERSGYRALYAKSDDPQDLARLENLDELLRAAREHESAEPEATAGSFLDAVSLTTDLDQLDGQERGVTLMTLHSAKGLEFPAVFLAGVEDGLLPHRSAFDHPDEMEEERRLAYVGITRAKDHLALTLARRRNLYGEWMPTRPSSFLEDVPDRLVEVIGAPPPVPAGRVYDFDDSQEVEEAPRSRAFGASRPVAVPAPAPGQPRELKKGMRVRHAQYGVGLILKDEGSGDSRKLTVYFERVGQKKLIAKYAPLQAL